MWSADLTQSVEAAYVHQRALLDEAEMFRCAASLPIRRGRAARLWRATLACQGRMLVRLGERLQQIALAPAWREPGSVA